jgi:Cu/Ag efflux pump CusA
MTSLAAILGLLPLALDIGIGPGGGPGAQMQRPLAIAVIGGLLANMLFTRMIIPVGYLALAGWRKPIESRLSLRESARPFAEQKATIEPPQAKA